MTVIFFCRLAKWSIREVDIAFATDEGVIFLSDLESNGVLENCGWFSRLVMRFSYTIKNKVVYLTVIEDKLYEGKYNDNKIRLYYEDL